MSHEFDGSKVESGWDGTPNKPESQSSQTTHYKKSGLHLLLITALGLEGTSFIKQRREIRC